MGEIKKYVFLTERLFAEIMILSTLLLSAICAAQQPNVQFVGVEKDTEYTIFCQKPAVENFPLDESSVIVKNCVTSECPDLAIADVSGSIRVTNFPVLASGSQYECSNGKDSYPVMIGVLEPAKPEVSAGSAEFKDASRAPTELAKCGTGYAQPAPIVVWKDETGKVVSSCNADNADKIDTNICFRDVADEENPYRVGADLTLVADVDGEGHVYSCEVTSWKAENGEKVEVTTSVRYPESGCITVQGGSCPGDEDTTAQPIAEMTQPAAFAETRRNEEEVPVSETSEQEDEDKEEEEGDDTFHNALLGTATGIVIFVIIIIIIWFIRKKNQNDDNGYTQGQDVQLKAEETQQSA